MKLKKLAAVAMAAVMSAAMLTACSGGGGGGKTTPNGTAYTEEYEIVERFVSDKATGEGEYKKIAKNDPYYSMNYETSNGTWTYYKNISVSSTGKREVTEYLYSMTESYIVNTHDSDDPSNWKACPEAPDPDEGDEGDSGKPSNPSPDKKEVQGTGEYNNVTYDTITRTTIYNKGTDKERTSIVTEYYVKGTKTLAYKRTESWQKDKLQSGRVVKVRLTNTVDPDSVTKLDIKNYAHVKNEDELA